MTAETINDIVDYIYSETFFSGYSYSFSYDPYVGQEIFSEYLLKICEEPIEKMISLFNKKQFNYYSASIIKNMVYNKYSNINKNVINYKYNDLETIENTLIEDDYIPLHSDEVDSLINEIDLFLNDYVNKKQGFWYDAELYKLYFKEGMTYRSISDLTKIPHTSIFLSIKKVKELLAKRFGDEYAELIEKQNTN